MKKILTFVAFFAAVACSKNESGSEQFGQIKIEPVITKATEVNFEQGDKIGVDIACGDEKYAENAEFSYDGTSFNGGLNWYAEGTTKSTFTAYYPYAATGLPTSFTVQADQSTLENLTKSDFMLARKSEVLPTGNPVTMVFKHKLTRMIVELTNESGGSIDEVILQKAKKTAKINPSTLEVSVDEDSEAMDIKANKIAENKYQLIVVPQKVAFRIVVKVGEKQLSQKFVAADVLSGGQYTAQVKVLPEDLQVAISGDIENWTDEGELTADNSVDFEEFENYFLYDGVKYPTIVAKDGKKWMNAPMRFVPKGKKVSDDPSDDNGIWYPCNVGKVADKSAEAIAASGYVYSVEAVFGAEVTPENYTSFEGAQGICPKGWHVPTEAELKGLVGEESPYYDKDYKGSSVAIFKDNGINWGFPSYLMKNTIKMPGKYLYMPLNESKCSNPDWYGKNAMGFWLSSTGSGVLYEKDSEVLKNIQFKGLMSTFTSKYKDGKLMVSNTNFKAGVSLRCVKN